VARARPQRSAPRALSRSVPSDQDRPLDQGWSLEEAVRPTAQGQCSSMIRKRVITAACTIAHNKCRSARRFRRGGALRNAAGRRRSRSSEAGSTAERFHVTPKRPRTPATATSSDHPSRAAERRSRPIINRMPWPSDGVNGGCTQWLKKGGPRRSTNRPIGQRSPAMAGQPEAVAAVPGGVAGGVSFSSQGRRQATPPPGGRRHQAR